MTFKMILKSLRKSNVLLKVVPKKFPRNYSNILLEINVSRSWKTNEIISDAGTVFCKKNLNAGQNTGLIRIFFCFFNKQFSHVKCKVTKCLVKNAQEFFLFVTVICQLFIESITKNSQKAVCLVVLVENLRTLEQFSSVSFILVDFQSSEYQIASRWYHWK